MLKKFIILNLIFYLLSSISLAETIKDISVIGNKRISKESIIVFGDIKFDKKYDQDDLNIILKNIYETNFFKKIDFNLKGSILNITVVENPIIESLLINGIKSKKLRDLILDKISLKSRKSFIESTFLSDLNLIKNIIRSSGYYFANIETESLINDNQNSVRLIYNIDLGKKAKINEIQFIGDKKVKDRILNNIITSEVSRFWKVMSQSVYLNSDRIELDKRLLINYYKDNGFYNANITNSFVEFKNNGLFKLIFNIEAGNKFKFNNIDLVLSEDYEPKYFDKIKNSIEKLSNQEYSLSKIEKVLREVDKIALSKQYEFIDATLEEEIVDGNKLNMIISLIDTQKFYVERINVFGNTYTLEEVVRNSFVVDEGDPFNEILFNRSLNNIKSRNIFSKVSSEISPGSDKNLKIIDITVEEKPTGEISLGAGVGSSGGTIGGGIKENNFLGKGIKLDSNLTLSENTLRGRFVYEKPNFNYSDNTLFTTINSTTTDNMSSFGYKTSNIGLSFGTSFEQYENLRFRPELSSSYEKLETTSNASSSLKKQEGDYFDTNLNYQLDYDLRNKRFRPDDGFRNVFYQELPIISDNFEIVNSFESNKYSKVSDAITKLSFYSKAVNTLNNENVRVSKRLFMPANRLRGFEPGKIGPKDKADFVGGNYITAVNYSATLPNLLPAFQNTDIAFFIDAANVWGVDYNSSLGENNKIRSAIGVALNVATPVGPLNFSLSQPITKNSTDVIESFRFNLGTTF